MRSFDTYNKHIVWYSIHAVHLLTRYKRLETVFFGMSASLDWVASRKSCLSTGTVLLDPPVMSAVRAPRATYTVTVDDDDKPPAAVAVTVIV